MWINGGRIIKRSKIGTLFFLIAALIINSGMSVLADDGYGTPADGFFTEKGALYHSGPTPAFMNGDFSQGLTYWTTTSGKKTTQNVELLAQGDNQFIHIISEERHDGISSPLFICDEAAPGQKLAVLFDWQGSMDFMVFLSQWDNGVETKIGGYYFGDILYEARNDAQWSTAAASVLEPVKAPADKNSKLVFSVSIVPTAFRAIDTRVDNVRLAVRNTNGSYKDLNGNPIQYEEPDEEDEDVKSEISNEATAPGVNQSEERAESISRLLIAGTAVSIALLATVRILLHIRKKAKS